MNKKTRKPRRKGHLAGRRDEVVLAAAADADAAGVTVDCDNGVIANVAVLTGGMAFPADSEPFEIDEAMLNQCVESINAAKLGVKSRISHPELAGGPHWVGGDSIFHLVGRCRNARLDGLQVRADMHLAKYADHSPNGKLRTYLLGIADEDPAACGISIRFLRGEYEQREDAPPLGRIFGVTAVDFVGTPGGNPNGLLTGEENTTNNQSTGDGSPGKHTGEATMKLNKRQKAYLASRGVGKDADDEQIATHLAGMKDEEKKYLDSLAGEDPPPKVKDDPPPAPAKEPAGDSSQNHLSGDEASAAAAKKAAEEALAADSKRRADIIALAATDDNDSAVTIDVARQWADDGVSLADAKRLAKLAADLTAVPAGRVDGGTDRNLSTIVEGVSDALLLRAGAPLMTFDPVTGLAERDDNGRIVARKPHERATTMRRMPVAEMARRYLSSVGVAGEQLTSLSGEECINVASCNPKNFSQRLRTAGGSVELAMSTSDFPYILADAMNKVFLGGYNLAPSTWALWCRRMTARDFKDVKLLNLGEAPALTARYEGQGITFGTLSESREVVALVEYVSGLTFTRRMQINDDLGVFQDGGAQSLGAMARYKEDTVVYAILTANAVLSDGIDLFHASHSNLSSGSSTAVYAAAAPGLCPTVVALFLDSEQSPVLKQEVQWDTDDLKVAVRHSVAAKAADYRGMYKDVTGNITVSSLAAILQAMVSQTGPGGAILNLRPAYIICPAGTKEVAFAQLVGSSVDPSKSNATPNPFFNGLTVIGEPRLI